MRTWFTGDCKMSRLGWQRRYWHHLKYLQTGTQKQPMMGTFIASPGVCFFFLCRWVVDGKNKDDFYYSYESFLNSNFNQHFRTFPLNLYDKEDEFNPPVAEEKLLVALLLILFKDNLNSLSIDQDCWIYRIWCLNNRERRNVRDAVLHSRHVLFSKGYA